MTLLAGALTGTLTPDGNGERRMFDARAECQRALIAHAKAHGGEMPRVLVVSSALWYLLTYGLVSPPRVMEIEGTVVMPMERAALLTDWPPAVGRAHQAAADGDPLGVSGPKESVR